jgi:hypothetical protein
VTGKQVEWRTGPALNPHYGILGSPPPHAGILCNLKPKSKAFIFNAMEIRFRVKMFRIIPKLPSKNFSFPVAWSLFKFH